MRSKALVLFLLLFGLWPVSASAHNRFIVRDTAGLDALQQVCATLGCTVISSVDGNLNQVFLVTAPFNIDVAVILAELLASRADRINDELDQSVALVPALNQPAAVPAGLSDTSTEQYFGTSVRNGYVNQPAAQIIRVSEAQSTFNVAGAGIVADIDTGVDPDHPALQGVLLQGWDFTRNQAGGSEMTDLQPPFVSPPPCTDCAPATVNQSTAAVLDQSTAAVLDGNPQYAAFGHGTMVMGVIHLVAPQAKLLPLKAFHSDGTGFLSDILSAIYFAVQNQANVINMSFDLTTKSDELSKALDFANQQNVICTASAGNDGAIEIVYPAAIQNDVMGVASTSDLDQRSTFSNYGDAIVWVAAPGEAVISTYPCFRVSLRYLSAQRAFRCRGSCFVVGSEAGHGRVPGRRCRGSCRAHRSQHGQWQAGPGAGTHRKRCATRRLLHFSSLSKSENPPRSDGDLHVQGYCVRWLRRNRGFQCDRPTHEYRCGF